MNALIAVKVAVVARGEVVRGGLAQMLERTAEVEDFAVFEPEEFSAGAPADAIQLLVLSSHMLVLWCANGSGLGVDEWAGELASVARRNGIQVVLALPGAEVRRAASGMVMPCDAVLDQDALTAEGLGGVLRRLARGERCMPEPAVRVVASAQRAGAVASVGSSIGLLTVRERQVLELLAEGLSNKQIGRALGLSEHGAKRLVAIVLSKLNCPNRTQAVAVALREGLVGGSVAGEASAS